MIKSKITNKMDDYGKNRIYKKIIVKLLRDRKLSINEAIYSLNQILITDYNLEVISRRTFDRAKKSLIEDGYKISSKKINGVVLHRFVDFKVNYLV